jgi:hypothetical protein
MGRLFASPFKKETEIIFQLKMVHSSLPKKKILPSQTLNIESWHSPVFFSASVNNIPILVSKSPAHLDYTRHFFFHFLLMHSPSIKSTQVVILTIVTKTLSLRN